MLKYNMPFMITVIFLQIAMSAVTIHHLKRRTKQTCIFVQNFLQHSRSFWWDGIDARIYSNSMPFSFPITNNTTTPHPPPSHQHNLDRCELFQTKICLMGNCVTQCPVCSKNMGFHITINIRNSIKRLTLWTIMPESCDVSQLLSLHIKRAQFLHSVWQNTG